MTAKYTTWCTRTLHSNLYLDRLLYFWCFRQFAKMSILVTNDLLLQLHIGVVLYTHRTQVVIYLCSGASDQNSQARQITTRDDEWVPPSA